MAINIDCEYRDLRNVLHHPSIPITYLSNPKVACSTIKNSLIKGHTENVHSKIEQICIYPNDQHHDIFSVTRNPFSRALSCYKNKIGWGKEATGNIWNTFRSRFNFPLECQPSFYDFLKSLAESKHDPQTLDIHYRPQFFNLHANQIVPSYIGRLEKFQHLKDYFARFSLNLQNRNPRPTGASETYRDEIQPDEAELIRNIYAIDFEHYGYELKLESFSTPPPIEQTACISDQYLLRFRLANLGLNTVNLRRIARRRERLADLPGALKMHHHLQLLNPESKDSLHAIKRLNLKIKTQNDIAGG